MTNAELAAVIKKHPVSVGCGVFAALLAAGIYFRSGNIPEAEVALGEKTAEVERHAANLKNAVQLKEQLEALQVANKEIDSRIVRADQRGLNTQFFYRLAGETGVRLITFQQGAIAAGSKGGKPLFKPVPFSLAAGGTLAQLIDFLHRLEAGEHYCRILTANIAVVAGKRDGPLTLTVNLELLGLP